MVNIQPPRLWLARAFMITILACLGGCGGSATVQLIPLNTRTMAPDTPLEYRFKINSCVWWVDDDDRINMAFRFDKLSPLGNLTRDALEISLVLDEMPAGTGREYRVNRHTVRGLWHRSALHLRLRSLTGIVVLDVMPNERLTGQFRFNCSARKFEVLTGWRRQSAVLVQGSFTAVHDPLTGPAVRERTEAGQPRSAHRATRPQSSD